MPKTVRDVCAMTLAVCALTVASGPAAMAQDRIPMLTPKAHSQWQAIGRLNVVGYNRSRTCTATLIAPDLVLTAAHCVVFGDGRAIPADLFRFVAGWFRGDYAAVGRVDRVTGAKAFVQARLAGDMPIAQDSALLYLSAPLKDIPPLPTGTADGNKPVRLLGYRWDRPHALTDTDLCDQAQIQGVFVLTCPATFGNSGGPVLQNQAGVWTVVGVVSAIDGQGRTFAAPLPPR